MKTNQILILAGVAIGAVIVYRKYFKKDSNGAADETSSASGEVVKGVKTGTLYCNCNMPDGTVKDGGIVASEAQCKNRCSGAGATGSYTTGGRMQAVRSWR
jgi:hypothetical protein